MHKLRTSIRCFVIMPFARSFDKVFKVYRETCESMGVYAYRVDNAVTIDILKNTFDGLKNNDFVIADISNNNCNVLFELGYLVGMKSTFERIILLSNGKCTDFPFDIRHLNVLRYNDSDVGLTALRDKLSKQIEDMNDFHATAYNCVYFFYRNLSIGKYKLSWNLLSRDFRDRNYKNDYKLFLSGYNSHTIKNLNVVESAIDKDVQKFYVSYISESEVPDIKDFPISENATMADLEAIVQNFNSFKCRLKNQGINETCLNDIPLKYAVAKNREDILLFFLHRGLQKESFNCNSVFKKTHQISMANYYEVTVVHKNNKWYVNKIISLFYFGS